MMMHSINGRDFDMERIDGTVPFGATAEPLTQSAFSVLSYNVHGLPAVVARDDPSDRSATIGWLANRYNVVLFQEDFEYHSTLRRQMLGKASVRGPGIGHQFGVGAQPGLFMNVGQVS